MDHPMERILMTALGVESMTAARIRARLDKHEINDDTVTVWEYVAAARAAHADVREVTSGRGRRE